MRNFTLSALIQFVSYFVLTLNFRAIAHAHIWEAMVTDALAAALSYFIIKRVSRVDGPGVLLGMMLGGSVAAAFAIWLTRAWG